MSLVERRSPVCLLLSRLSLMTLPVLPVCSLAGMLRNMLRLLHLLLSRAEMGMTWCLLYRTARMTLVMAEVTLKPALFPVVMTLLLWAWAPLLTLAADMEVKWLRPLVRKWVNGPLLSEMADYVANRELLRLFTMKLFMPCGLRLALLLTTAPRCEALSVALALSIRA